MASGTSKTANRRLKVIFCSHAFPPGVSGRFPRVQTAPHSAQTRMGLALGKLTELATVGWIHPEVFGQLEPRDDSIGLEHELLLWDLKPELWHRWRSWRKLRAYYLKKVATEGMPDVFMVSNILPVFNHFIRWLKKQPRRPLIVLFLADCEGLGQPASFIRRLRYQLKPMQMLEDDAVYEYDACVAISNQTRQYFEPKGIPWMWMPAAFNYHYDPPADAPALDGPIRFGYFGGIAENSAVFQTVRAFERAEIPGTLHFCGSGKSVEALKKICAENPRIKYDGVLKQASDCLAWAQKVDVLLNPRLPMWANSFPSKVMEYGVTGKAILSTKVGGVDEVIGENGLFFDAENLEESLRQSLQTVAQMDRAELNARGAAIRQRILQEYNWDVQARRMVDFFTSSLEQRSKVGA
jgi:glycosyltransferase involved in cell wall biosynthesis